MLKYDNVSHFTSFHEKQNVFMEPSFNVVGPFTEKMIQMEIPKMLMKIGLITVVSGAFGFAMGFVMSSFEFNATMGIDTNRSTRS